jgi:signal transduction histidine kinase
MADQTKKQLRIATIIFWFLLLYIIAALIWWFFSLEQQNHEIHNLKKNQLSSITEISTEEQLNKIENSRKRNSTKYISEGITFLLLILVGAFYIYRMVKRQFQLQQQQQNFIMAVTHELKTPISVAQLNLETIQKHQLDEQKHHKLIHMTLQETQRLDALINNILITSQLDGDAYTTSFEELDLSQLVRNAAENFKSRYPERKFIIDITADMEVKGDPLLLKLLVSNLLENAKKYSERNTVINCKLYEQNKKVILEVSDEGIGISDDEKKKIFQKFYRTGNEQTRKTKGTGLGLYICKKIVQQHKAAIDLIDNAPQGSTFTVTLDALKQT